MRAPAVPTALMLAQMLAAANGFVLPSACSTAAQPLRSSARSRPEMLAKDSCMRLNEADEHMINDAMHNRKGRFAGGNGWYACNEPPQDDPNITCFLKPQQGWSIELGGDGADAAQGNEVWICSENVGRWHNEAEHAEDSY
jgi:hypothetical protein